MARDYARQRAAAIKRYWGGPVPEGIRHGQATWAAKIYGCDCRRCLPSGRRKRQIVEGRALTGAERRKRSRENLRGKPVPEHVKHGIYCVRVYACDCEVGKKAASAARQRQRNAWRKTARGVWTELPDRVIIHWKPANAGEDWVCPDCGWAPEGEVAA